MEKFVTSNLKLGIISGGQLGKMLIQEASKWDIISYVMDSDVHCSAAKIASHFVKGDSHDFESVYQFGKMVDVLTFEIEHVNIEALKKLKAEGLKIAPDPGIMELIQDKRRQKAFYRRNGIPTAPFNIYESKEAILCAIEKGELGYPFVQKLAKGGYDGRGVAVLGDERETRKILAGVSVIEEKIAIEKEIAVIVARNKKGEIRCYPVVEMLFHSQANLVDKIICPAAISQEQADKAVHIACKLVELLNMEGLLVVEMFIDSRGEIMVNEAAPRPHNSGHHTIESVITSQFEQHLRAILNLPLGSTHLKIPSVMINILGAEGYEGPVVYEGLTESMGIDGVKIHLYGKKITKPYRKMGHATVLSASPEALLQKAEEVKQLIKVVSWKKHE